MSENQNKKKKTRKKAFSAPKKNIRRKCKKKQAGRNYRQKKLAGPEYSGERAMYNIHIAGPTGRKVINVINNRHVIDCCQSF